MRETHARKAEHVQFVMLSDSEFYSQILHGVFFLCFVNYRHGDGASIPGFIFRTNRKLMTGWI